MNRARARAHSQTLAKLTRQMRGGALFLFVTLLGSLTFACRGSESLPPPPLPPDLSGRVLPKPPGSEDFAHRGFGYPLSVEDAEAILRQTEVFEFGGMPPKRQVQAFNVVSEQPDAIPRFQSIADEGAVAGRLYALAGLLVLDAKAAERVRASLSRGVHGGFWLSTATPRTRSRCRNSPRWSNSARWACGFAACETRRAITSESERGNTSARTAGSQALAADAAGAIVRRRG